MLITAELVVSISALSESLAGCCEALKELLIGTEQLAVLLVVEVKRCNLKHVVIRWDLLQQRRVSP